MNYLIGIDGGGTSCRAALANRAGMILGRGRSGAANILTDPNDAILNIEAAARQACVEAGLPAETMKAAPALMGLAGSNVGDFARYVASRLPFGDTAIVSDGIIALQGALGDGDGGIAILGTGSLFMSRIGSDIRAIGGWGFQVGDHGGGARLGRSLLQEVLLVHDGIRAPSELTRSTLETFNGDPKAIVEFARHSKPSDFARLAPGVFEAAENGDAVGLRLVRQAAAMIDEALDALGRGECPRVALLGGLAALYPPYLSEQNRAILVMPQQDALTGSVALAVKRFVHGDLRGTGEEAGR